MKKAMVLLIVALIALQGVALANTVSGKVTAVDATGNKIQVASASGESSWILYSATTKWAGVTSPAELQGKSVQIEAIEDAAKNWQATSITVAAQAAAALQASLTQAPAAAAPASEKKAAM